MCTVDYSHINIHVQRYVHLCMQIRLHRQQTHRYTSASTQSDFLVDLHKQVPMYSRDCQPACLCVYLISPCACARTDMGTGMPTHVLGNDLLACPPAYQSPTDAVKVTWAAALPPDAGRDVAHADVTLVSLCEHERVATERLLTGRRVREALLRMWGRARERARAERMDVSSPSLFSVQLPLLSAASETCGCDCICADEPQGARHFLLFSKSSQQW